MRRYLLCKRALAANVLVTSAALITFAAAGCSGDPGGTYLGLYNDGSFEVVGIFPNKTYEQILVKDGRIVYWNRGAWRFQDGFEFLDFIAAFGGPGGREGVGPEFFDWYETLSDGPDELVLSQQDNYSFSLRRVSPSATPNPNLSESMVKEYRDKFRKTRQP